MHNTICAPTLETVVPFDKMQISFFFLFIKSRTPLSSSANLKPIPLSPYYQWALTAGGLNALQAACVCVVPLRWAYVDTWDPPLSLNMG